MSKTRKQYYTMIWTYMQRRKAINQKIQVWRREIKRMDEKSGKAEKIIEAVNSYFDVNILQKSNKPQYVLARNCYYKYGMEEGGLRGFTLAKKIGLNNPTRASENRLSFTRSFPTKPNNQKTYHKFKEYIANSA